MAPTKISKTAVILTIAAGLIGSSAVSAGQPVNMEEWKEDATNSINRAMLYPSQISNRALKGDAQFTVTIGRDGKILASQQNIRPKNFKLNSAAKTAMRMVEFPELPASYAGKGLTFTLNLNYRSSRTYKPKRKGNVRTELASNSSGILVIEAASE